MSPPSSRRVHFADLQKIQVDLIGTENTLPGQPKVVFYVFCVRIPCSAFVKEEIEIRISKRYSDFRTLNGELEQIIGNLPGLPSKTSVMPTWFGGGNDMNALSERKVKLYEYLRSILKIPAVLRCQKLWAFLDFAVSNISVVDEGVPQLKLTLNDPRFGVNAVCYDAESGIVLSACEDSDPVSRLSTLVVNKARMAFDKRSEKEKIPMGIFNVWKRGPNSIWDVVCSNTFDCQATALAWDRARQRCFLGLDNGFINVYSVPHPFQSMTLIKEIQVHALRISELIYDPSTDVLVRAIIF